MGKRGLLNTFSYGLLVLLVLFGVGQASEIFHPIEEPAEEAGHDHTASVCLTGETCSFGSHSCPHSLQLSPAVQLEQDFCNCRVDSSLLPELEEAPRVFLHFYSLRGPPLLG